MNRPKIIKKVLITGANGFVGQHLVRLLENRYQIIGLTHSSPNLVNASKKIKYYEGDIDNEPFVIDVISRHKPDAIIHLAAKTQTWFSDTPDIFRVNVFGTINLYESVIKIREKSNYHPRIIYISSSEIYGNTSSSTRFSEKTPLLPLNPYAASKASADRTSYAYTQSQKLDIIIARPFTHTGPGQSKGFFIPDMATQIVQIENSSMHKELRVGNLESIRDYLDVRDVVRAYELLLEADIKPGEVFNICSGRGIRVGDLLQRLIKISGIKVEPKQDATRMRSADAPFFVGNATKLKNLTGWQPEIGLNRTLKETLDYWRQINN